MNILDLNLLETKFTISDLHQNETSLRETEPLINLDKNHKKSSYLKITLNEKIEYGINDSALSFIPFLKRFNIGSQIHYICFGFIGNYHPIEKNKENYEVVFTEADVEIIRTFSINKERQDSIEDEIIQTFYKYQRDFPTELSNFWPENWFPRFQELQENENKNS